MSLLSQVRGNRLLLAGLLAVVSGAVLLGIGLDGDSNRAYAGGFTATSTPTATVRPRTATPEVTDTVEPTETAVPDTATPEPPTEVPPTATTAPVGSPGAGIQPPATGTGSGSGGNYWWAVAGGILAAVLALGGAGLAVRRTR